MCVDESKKFVLTKHTKVRGIVKVIESDHNVEILEINLEFSNLKPERIKIFQFKNINSQIKFKN